MTTTLHPRCPSCSKSLARVDAMSDAVEHITRTCRNPECRERWFIRIGPKHIDGGMIHVLDYTFQGRAANP